MTSDDLPQCIGLPAQQRTTARDMATLGLRLQRDFPKEFAYFSRPSFTFGGRVVRTHNRLLGRMQGVDGIKTGYTRASGFNLVTSAGRRQAAGRRGDGRGLGRPATAIWRRCWRPLPESRQRQNHCARRRPAAGFNAAAAVAVAAATSDPPPARMQLAGVPVPRREARDRGTGHGAGAGRGGGRFRRGRRSRCPGVGPVADQGAKQQPTPRLRTSCWNSQAPRQRSRRPAAPPPRSAPQGDFGTGSRNPIDPSEDAVAVGKSDSLFVMRQAAPAPGKTITTVKSARASLAAAPTIEPASLTRGAAADLSAHSATAGTSRSALSSSSAQERADAAKAAAADLLRGKISFTMPVSRGNDTIFRARFSGFDEAQAREACKRLSRKGVGCFPLAPHG